MLPRMKATSMQSTGLTIISGANRLRRSLNSGRGSSVADTHSIIPLGC